MSQALRQWSQHERLNFLLTNRIPRQTLTHFVGWLSRIENPLLARCLIAVWRLFAEDLRLEEAEKQSFSSLRDCFIRRLKPGARPMDARADVLTSPCDAVVGECGAVEDTTVFQAKGFPYDIGELMHDPQLRARYRNGSYVTLRLKSSMYHRFHAPAACRTEQITYISGDTWNVNPIALKRVEKLYCRNERAVIELEDLAAGGDVCLVPVAAILVASMAFTGLRTELSLRYRGPNRIPWPQRFSKGDEMGYFQHGSTIIMFATAPYALCEGLSPGTLIRMGQPLLRTAPSTHPIQMENLS